MDFVVQEIDHTLIYDGWVLTLESHAAKVYTRSAVPQTLDEMLDEIAWRFEPPPAFPADAVLLVNPASQAIYEKPPGRPRATGHTVTEKSISKSRFGGDRTIQVDGRDEIGA